jgi:hypothetical protein
MPIRRPRQRPLECRGTLAPPRVTAPLPAAASTEAAARRRTSSRCLTRESDRQKPATPALYQCCFVASAGACPTLLLELVDERRAEARISAGSAVDVAVVRERSRLLATRATTNVNVLIDAQQRRPEPRAVDDATQSQLRRRDERRPARRSRATMRCRVHSVNRMPAMAQATALRRTCRKALRTLKIKNITAAQPAPPSTHCHHGYGGVPRSSPSRPRRRLMRDHLPLLLRFDQGQQAAIPAHCCSVAV